MTTAPGNDRYHGHGSRERLEAWLDTQIAREAMSEAHARTMLPDYEPLELFGSPAHGLKLALDSDAAAQAADTDGL